MLSGVVIEGRGRARVLGLPTANIELFDHAEAPPDGIYSCWLRIQPELRVFGATMSVGDSPGFDGDEGKRVEAYVHGFAGDLRGSTVDVHVAARLGPIQCLESVADLIAQTADHVGRSRAVLGLVGPPNFD